MTTAFLEPTATPATSPRLVAGTQPANRRWYHPPTISVPEALERITDCLDELLDATASDLAPLADDLSEALELLRNAADKVADDRAGRGAAA